MLVQLAYEQGQSMAAFCRDRIMARENLNDEFSSLQRTLIATIHDVVKHHPIGTNPGDVNGAVQAMITEVLLLLRSLVPPQKMQAVHSELKRTGLEPFISR